MTAIDIAKADLVYNSEIIRQQMNHCPADMWKAPEPGAKRPAEWLRRDATKELVELATPTVADLIMCQRELVAHDETLFNDEGALLVLPEEADASERSVSAAFNSMMAAPCLSLDDVRAKADYLLNGTVGERDPVLHGLAGPDGGDIFAEGGPLLSFIRSLAPA